MLAQFKTHLAVYGGGWMMVEKMIDWETHVQHWIHSNARIGLQRITFFLGFKFDLRLLRFLKLLPMYIFWGIMYLSFASLFDFIAMFHSYTGV